MWPTQYLSCMSSPMIALFDDVAAADDDSDDDFDDAIYRASLSL